MKAIKKVLIIALALVLFASTLDVAYAASKKATLSKSQVTLEKGKSTTIKLKNYKGSKSWSTTNKKVATVNSKGKVTAKGYGSCTIKCKIKVQVKGKTKKQTLKCKVIVPKPTSKPTPNPTSTVCSHNWVEYDTYYRCSMCNETKNKDNDDSKDNPTPTPTPETPTPTPHTHNWVAHYTQRYIEKGHYETKQEPYETIEHKKVGSRVVCIGCGGTWSQEHLDRAVESYLADGRPTPCMQGGRTEDIYEDVVVTKYKNVVVWVEDEPEYVEEIDYYECECGATK